MRIKKIAFLKYHLDKIVNPRNVTFVQVMTILLLPEKKNIKKNIIVKLLVPSIQSESKIIPN